MFMQVFKWKVGISEESVKNTAATDKHILDTDYKNHGIFKMFYSLLFCWDTKSDTHVLTKKFLGTFFDYYGLGVKRRNTL